GCVGPDADLDGSAPLGAVQGEGGEAWHDGWLANLDLYAGHVERGEVERPGLAGPHEQVTGIGEDSDRTEPTGGALQVPGFVYEDGRLALPLGSHHAVEGVRVRAEGEVSEADPDAVLIRCGLGAGGVWMGLRRE